MKLSEPIHQLKRKARRLSREEDLPLHEALDRIARTEGCADWSLLAARYADARATRPLPEGLRPGDLVLLGARPGQGKTLKSLALAVDAMKAGNRAFFFTLEYTERDVIDRLAVIGADYGPISALFKIDCSDAINADYIVSRLASAERGTLVVIDYLQLLDQRRDNPGLEAQVRRLKSFARERGLVMVFISQIDRSYDPERKPFPDLQDVRLPNPLDLGLFDKACFLHRGDARFHAMG